MSQPEQQQTPPGTTAAMTPRPDHGEDSYRGSDRLANKIAVITGADSEIGRAVAIAFAREGADVVISYLNEDEDARQTLGWVQKARSSIWSRPHCRTCVGGRRSSERHRSTPTPPTPHLLPYDVTKAGIANMVGALAGMLAERGIRANSVAPGPIWTR